MQGNAYGRHEIDAGFGINSSSASYLRQSAQSPQNSQPQMVSSDIPVTHWHLYILQIRTFAC